MCSKSVCGNVDILSLFYACLLDYDISGCRKQPFDTAGHLTGGFDELLLCQRFE